MNEMQSFASQFDEKVNASVSKVLAVGFASSENLPVILDWKTLEEVDRFTYLRSVITDTDPGKKHIDAHTEAARVALCWLRTRLCCRSETKINTEVRIYQNLVRKILHHSC